MTNVATAPVSRKLYGPTWAPWLPEHGAERRCFEALRHSGEMAALGPEAVPAARAALTLAGQMLLVWSDEAFEHHQDQCSPEFVALTQAQDDIAQAEACLRRLERGPGLAKAHPAAPALEAWG
jgi:hypothetical protein